jgi:hypothetical protein
MKDLCLTYLAVALLLGSAPTHAQNAPAPVPATAENAAAFLGEWTVAATGSYGQTTLDVSLKVTDGKVVGEVASAATGKQPLADISKSGPSLVFVYSFDYQGMPIRAVVTLTPGDKKVDAYLDFADGAAQFTGTATKKEK